MQKLTLDDLVQESLDSDPVFISYYIRELLLNRKLVDGDELKLARAWSATAEYQLGHVTIGSDDAYYISTSPANHGNDPLLGRKWITHVNLQKMFLENYRSMSNE